MEIVEQYEKAGQALEISAGLSGRRFGLCGYDAGETQRISRFLSRAGSVAVPFDERTLGESARFCDAVLFKLAAATAEGLRTAATAATAPILVTSPNHAILEGVGAAYLWPSDFMGEPWTEAELLVRLFRLLQPPRKCPSAPKPRKQPLVLLVDDDPESIALAQLTLCNDGITCRTAKDGLSALRVAREFIPDLMVLDVKMPRMDGFEVLETLRRDPGLQTIPVILLTGCDDPTDVVRGAELDADEFLGKPVSSIRLLNRVKRLLSTHARVDRQWVRALPESVHSVDAPARPWIQRRVSGPETGEQA